MRAIVMLADTVPVACPIIQSLGIAPVRFSIITNLTVELGLITLRVGINDFVIRVMAHHAVLGITFKGVAPFIVSDFMCLAKLTLFTMLSIMFFDLTLPSAAHG